MESSKNNIAVSEKLKSNYDGYYKEDKSKWRWLGALDKVNNIIDLSSSYPHESILEIGSGDGSLLKRMSDLNFGKSLFSLEISETAVSTIRKRKIPSLVSCELFNGYNIPCEDNKFDLVILSHIIEHVEHPRQLIYEASRVARHLFFEVPLEDNLRLKKDYVFSKVGHINAYSPKTFRRMIQTCDLEILSEIITNPSYALYAYQTPRTAFIRYFPKKCLLKISPQLATLLGTYHYSMVCRKKHPLPGRQKSFGP